MANGIEEFEGGGWLEEGEGEDSLSPGGLEVEGEAEESPAEGGGSPYAGRNRGWETGGPEVADLLAGKPKSVPVGERTAAAAATVSEGEGEFERGDGNDFYRMTPEEEAWLSELSPGTERSLEEDWEWVTQHLDNRWLRVQSVPSLRCWSMLKWARKGNNRGTLYTRIMDAVVKARGKEGAAGPGGGGVGEGGERDELDRASEEELREMLMEAMEEAMQTRMVKGGGLEVAKRGKGKK